MSSNPFTQAEIQELAARVDQRLAEIEASQPDSIEVSPLDNSKLVGEELKAVAEATGEKPESFWERFKKAAQRDICEEGGKLYGLWGQVNSQDLIAYSAGVVTSMGLGAAVLPTAVVAVTVILLHIGIRALCND